MFDGKVAYFILLLFFSAVTLVVPGWTGETGRSGAAFLKITGGPRAAAMGEAQVAAAHDSYASYWNPAGLSRLERPEVAMTHQQSIEDVQEQNMNIALPLTRDLALGAYATMVSVKPFSSFNATGAEMGSVESSERAFGAAFGFGISKALSLGAGFKHIQSTLGPASAATTAFDAGFLYRIRSFRLAGVVKNLGPALVYDRDETPLPKATVLGIGHEKSWRKTQLVSAVEYNFSDGRKNFFSIGEELWLGRIIALRVGYRSEGGESSGFRAGLGFGLKNMQLSYSLSPFGALGDSHRFGLSVRFGPSIQDGPLFKRRPKQVKKPVASTAIQPSSPTVQMVVPAIVGEPVPAVPPVYINPIPSPAPSPSPAPKSKVQKPLPDNVPELIKVGTAWLKEGKFQQATKAFGKTLKIDPNNKTALELMRKSLNELDREERRVKGIYD